METLERDLGERVLIYRRRLKMNQAEFADYLRRNGLQNRKWTGADISELETEKMNPRLSDLKDLAFAMGMTVDTLLNEAKGASLNSERDSRTSLTSERYIFPDWHPINAGVSADWHARDTVDLREPLQKETLPLAVGL